MRGPVLLLRNQCTLLPRTWITRMAFIIFFFLVFVFVKYNRFEPEEIKETNKERNQMITTTTHDFIYSPSNSREVMDMFDSENYLIKSNKTFIQQDTSTSVVICVGTAVQYFAKREAVRQTYGSQNIINGTTEIILLFFVGKSQNKRYNDKLNEEISIHNDIVQADFVDKYRNLTLKSMAMLRYVYENYDDATYIVKIDDDTFLNLPVLLRDLENLGSTKRVLIGHLFKNSKPVRNSKSKYFVPKSEYDLDKYPKFVSGSCYVMSTDVALSLWEACQHQFFIPMEDVFITGICANLIDLVPKNNPRFHTGKLSKRPCAYKNQVCGHFVKPTEMKAIWNGLQNKNLVCPKKK